MKSWPLQTAKKQFTQVVDLAQTEGPQSVTQDGEPVAIVLSARQFGEMSRPKESVLEFFKPLKGSGINLKRIDDLSTANHR